ncbi:hypothetical protein RHMOL_Rhmol12G0162400 [Rhododendron molle]|uniref:Uncharacterized protein n=1 Tax=Rhododendron molle TaxID=49168 RepID=A0ACC0LJB6_RHOML|nr:hypothetical protein RHMOL_Rhmol12G0162400 [Rhododendron molle]
MQFTPKGLQLARRIPGRRGAVFFYRRNKGGVGKKNKMGGGGAAIHTLTSTCFAIVASDVVTSHLVLHEGKKLRLLDSGDMGSLIRSFDYICTHGLAHEKYYPYTGNKGLCKRLLRMIFGFERIKDFCTILFGGQEQMLLALGYGPLAVTIV